MPWFLSLGKEMEGNVTMPHLRTRALPQSFTHRLAALGLQLACVGVLGVALEGNAQTVTPPVLGPCRLRVTP